MPTIEINENSSGTDHLYIGETERLGKGGWTSLKDAIASTTSFVKVFPTPDVPINIVGLIAWLIGSMSHQVR